MTPTYDAHIFPRTVCRLALIPSIPIQDAGRLPTITETKEHLRKSTIDAYYDEYKEYANYWRNLEAKSQGNVAVAGIFIAAAFTVITKTEPQLSEVERLLLLLSVGFLFMSVIFSILVLRIRRIPAPPLGSFADYTVKRLLEADDAEFHERLRRFRNDHVNKWRSVMARTAKAVQLKADRLWVAQVLLILAVLMVAALAAVKIINLKS